RPDRGANRGFIAVKVRGDPAIISRPGPSSRKPVYRRRRTSVTHRVDDDVDGHLETDGRCIRQIVFRPFPSISDVLVVADDDHHAAVVIEYAEVHVVFGPEPRDFSGFPLRRHGRVRIHVVINRPDRVIRRKLYGFAIREDLLDVVIKVGPLTPELTPPGVMEIVDDHEAATREIAAEGFDLLVIG